MMGQIVLIRHGETEWSTSGKHTGSTDISLTSAGEEAARKLVNLIPINPDQSAQTSAAHCSTRRTSRHSDRS